ncbi:sulfurtransferase TusA family protein [Thermithiobacillus plumbiphilus]|uniref:Sulfurtransferase TusA family protein n=1 Tax=Thermithiobacillus plumbiphilus TaxID=1729899 RepID=A0ABU9D7L1_9PROT
MRSADCLGAVCPRPQLLAVNLLNEVGPGEVVEIVTDNPTAVEGFAPLAEILLCTLLAVVKEPGGWRIYLQKSQ